jgi:hypothetical protein
MLVNTVNPNVKTVRNAALIDILTSVLEINSKEGEPRHELAREIEYCPVWTLGNKGQKILKKLCVRIKGTKEITFFGPEAMGACHITPGELMDLLLKTDAVKIPMKPY